MKRVAQWRVADDEDRPPVELLAAPRWLCTIDGTRVYTPEDADAHDAHFHPKVVDKAGRPEPDDRFLRREALEWAVRTCSHAASAEAVTKQADAFLAFLRGGGS